MNMPAKKLFASWCTAATVLWAVPLFAAPPNIACGILPNDAISIVDSVYRVSNIAKIGVQAVLVSTDGRSLSPLSLDDPSGAVRGSFRIDVVARPSGAAAPATLTVASLGQAGAMLRATVLVEIPIDATARHAAVSNYADAVRNSVTAERPADDPAVEIVTNNAADLVTMLETMFVENRVGIFELTCRYREDVNTGFGTVVSKPLTVEVIDQGHFFDQPRFQLR